MNEQKGILLVLATAIISGISIYINSIGVKFSNPYVFTGMKNLLVGVALFGIILGIKKWHQIKQLSKRDWLWLMLIGLIGGALPFLLFFKGLSLTSASQGGFIHKSMFVFVAFLAVLFLKEKWNKSIFIGLAALFIGNVLFLGFKPQIFSQGDLLVLLATLFWSVEIILSKKLLARLSGIVVGWGRMFFGGIFIAMYLLSTHQLQPLFSYQIVQWKWIAITSLFLLGYVWTFYNGLKHVRASVATAILALGAPITSLITLIAAGQVKLVSAQWWGVGIMVTGVILLIGLKKVIKTFMGTFER